MEISNKELAEEMAELTCELARVCASKQQQFASNFNLTPAEFKLLRLFSNTSSLSIKTISVMMDLTPGRITHILTSLESKKFVKRKSDPKDKRNVIVSLTGNSEPFIKNLNLSHVKLHEEILDNVDPDRRHQIVQTMRDVITALKKWSQSQNNII